jgi:glutamyl-tRNA synthetase
MTPTARRDSARRAMSVRVRFAPSPSGYLHIGGARSALFAWLWARSQGGEFLVRIEDTDAERSTEESVRAMLGSLRWLGLNWDEGPGVGGPHAPYFQSQRKDIYKKYADQLVEEGKAYRCYCTKEELDALREAHVRTGSKDAFRYPGVWRDRRDWPANAPYVIRFKSPEHGSTAFRDKVFGVIETPNREQGDFVIVRSDGFPLYNFSCVIDDTLMGITLVSRGREHIGSTPPQLLLYAALGFQVPEFAHLPLMLSPDGEKLSKRHAAVSVEEYRERGYTPDGVLNYLVRFGWSHGDQEIFQREELVSLFSWDHVNKADGRFDPKKFADVAFEHLKEPRLLSTSAYAEAVRPWLAKRGLEPSSAPQLEAAIETIRPRAHTLVEAADALDYYFRAEPEMDGAAAKFLVPAAAPLLAELETRLGVVAAWDEKSVEASVETWVAERGLSMKDFAQAARVALTGRKASPGLFQVMAVLGREVTLARLHAASERAASASR